MSHFFVSSGQSIGASASSISPSNEYSGLISFRIDLFDLLAVQGTLRSLLQHHNSKTSILQHSAFFTVQLSTSVLNYWKNHSMQYLFVDFPGQDHLVQQEEHPTKSCCLLQPWLQIFPSHCVPTSGNFPLFKETPVPPSQSFAHTAPSAPITA